MVLAQYNPSQAQTLQRHRGGFRVLGADPQGSPVVVPQDQSASKVIWSLLFGVTGFGVGVALGTIWGAKALHGR